MADSRKYDLAIVGGGIAGSSLAKCMAESGARVLLLEAAPQFKDRVRGEVLVSWGTAEAKSLGLGDALTQAGARQLRWCNHYLGAMQTERRDLPATTLTKTPVITFYHPAMQERILQTAESAGAQVKRGAEASLVTTGFPAKVHWNDNGHTEKAEARLLVIADGRNSPLRRSLGFEVKKETHSGCIAGIIFENVSLPEDTLHWFINPAVGEAIGWAPEGESRVRTYLCYWGDRKPRYRGPSDVSKFLADLKWTGIAPEYFSKAQTSGPLATFDGADTWVDQLYKEGVALLGDTAASNDPPGGKDCQSHCAGHVRFAIRSWATRIGTKPVRSARSSSNAGMESCGPLPDGFGSSTWRREKFQMRVELARSNYSLKTRRGYQT